MLSQRPIPVKRLALLVAAAVVLALLVRPGAAFAATSVSSTGNAIRVNLTVLGQNVGLTLPATANWSDGQATASNTAVNANVPSVLTTGTVADSASAATGGGKASGNVTGLNVLGSTLGADAVGAQCQMTATDISGSANIANLKLLGAPASVQADGTISLPGVLTAKIKPETASWNTSTGLLTYTVQAINLNLLAVTGAVASGNIVIGEAICKGNVKLGTISTTTAALTPGQSGTPVVTVSNTGDVAAPNTTVTIPKPDATYYTLGAPTVVGGVGTCDTSGTAIVCSGITVPGGGNAKINLPVTLKSSATASTPSWLPAAGTVKAVSTPIAADTSASMTITGGGTALATAQPRSTTGGTITVNAGNLTAGKTAAPTITVANAGPSDASNATVTVPIGNIPAGVSVTSVSSSSGTCTFDSNNATCTNVSIPAGGTATITLNTAATNSTKPGTTWDLANVTTTLNGKVVNGFGRLLTVTDPDINLDNGVSITPAAANPGGAKVNATVNLANLGALASPNTTVTFPPVPSGYTIDTANISAGGGTCAVSGGVLTCTGVNVPAMSGGNAGSATLTVPVSLSSGTTANWSGTVTATAPGTTGTATGTLVTAVPRYTLSAGATGPAARTVSPGQNTTMTINVSNQGPSNAVSAPFVVVAPQGTTFGSLTGAVGSACQSLTPTTIRCTVTASPTDPAISLDLPLQVSASADPSTPLTGGCVSLDNDSSCGGPTDSALPGITLRQTLANRLTVTATPATITPGSSGVGKIALTSAQAETGMQITVPKSALPAGFTVGGATVDGGTCDTSGASIVCTGVDLVASTTKNLQITVQVAATAAGSQTWTANGITVQSGNEQVTTNGALATTTAPSYTLTASVSVPPAGTVLPGGTANVPLTVTNTGPSAASPASFSVTAPNGTTIGPLDANTSAVCQVSANNTQLTCSTGLGVNATTQQLTLPLVVAANADPDKPISGSCVELDGYPGCGAGDTTIPPITLKVPAASQVGFASTTATVTPGDTATAKVSISATRATLTNTVVTIPVSPVPAGLTVGTVSLAGGATCPVTGNTATCTIPSIAPGTPQVINVAVGAGAGATTGTWTAQGITATIPAGTVTAADQTLATIGAPRNVVTATVAVPNTPILPGGTGSITVNVNNTGPSDATGASFTVIAPNGATFAPPAPSGCTIAAGGRSASCTFNQTAAAPPTAFPFTVQTSSNVQPGTGLTGGCVDVDNNGVCTSADTAMPAIPIGTPLQNQLTVTSSPATVTPGSATPSTATLTISAPSNLNDLVVSTSTAAPTGLSVLTAAGPNGTCNPQANGSFNCGDVDLSGANHSANITLTMTAVAAATPATWAPSFTITSTDGQTATDTATMAVIGSAQTNLTVSSSGPAAGTTDPGTTANVTVTVANTGPSDAVNQVVVLTAPSGTTFGTPPAGCQTVTSTRMLCRVNALANGNASVTVPVVIPASADVFTPITGGCVDVGGDGTCEGTLPTITFRQPVDRRATVTVTPVTVTPGSSGNSVVRVTAANGDLTNFTITVPVTLQTSDLQLGSITPSGACAASSGTTVTCTWASITKGNSQDITIPVQATAGAAAGLTATTTGITIADNVGSANLAARQLAVTGTAQAAVNPTFGTVTATEPGTTGTIPLILTNAGPSDATGTQVSVVAPNGTTFGTPLPAGCVADSTQTNLTCTVSIANGGTRTLALPVAVPASADPTGTISGGCVDANNNGVCTSPPDTALPSMPLTSRLDQEVTVRADRAALSLGGDTKQAKVTITSTKAQNVDVAIPLTDVPSGWTVTAASPAGCTTGASAITCTGLALSTGNNVITLSVTSPAGAATGDNWYASGITVTGHTNETVTSGALMAVVGTVPYILGAAVSGVPADDTVLPGATVPLTVTISNSGTPSASLKAPVQITAPTGTTFGTTMPADCVRNTATTVNCQVGVNATGQVASYALPILIPGNAAGGTVIKDGCVDLDASGSCDVTVNQFTLRAPLSDVVTAGSTTQATPAPGQTGTATVNLAASAVRPGLGVSVSLAGLPTGVTVTAVRLGGQTCTVANGTATCPATDFPATGSTPLAIDFAANSATTPGATWRPAITVADPGQDSVVLRPVALTVGAADTDVAVSLVLPDNGTVLPGGTADAEVTMTNNGDSDDPAATATFTAPAGTTFDLTNSSAANFCTADSATQVTCSTSLAAGANAQFRLLMKVAGTAAAGSTVAGGCVNVTGGNSCDTAIAFTLGKPFSDQAKLTYTRATVVPGDTGTGYIKVTTDRALTGLTVTVPLSALPAGVDIAGASGPTGASCTVNSADIVCSGVDLAQGSALNLVSVRIHPASNLGANVIWAPVAALTNGSGGTSEGAGVLLQTSAPQPDVKYTMSAPDSPVAPGSVATITGTLINQGYSDLTNVSVRVKAPTGTTFGSPLPAGCTAVGTAAMDCVVNLPAGAAAPVSWSLPVQIPANADPSQQVTGGCVDYNRDGVCGTGELALPAITLTATLAQALTIGTPVNGGANLTPGVTDTVTIAVSSTQARTGMTVTIPIDNLPTGMQLVQARTDNGSCSVGQRAVTCTGVSVAANGTTNIVLTSVVSGTAPIGTWSPQVTVSQGSQAAEQTVTAAATITAPQTSVAVTVGVPASQTVLPGGTGTLTLTATNTGPSQATGVTYSTIAPVGTTFGTLTGAAASQCTRITSTQVTCQMTVAGNGRAQVALPITVDATASPSTPITGGCVKSGTGSTCSGSDYKIPDIALATPLSGKVQLAGVPATVVPGRTGSGVLKITATGPVSGATISIPLAAKPTWLTVTGASGPTGSTCAIGATAITCTGVNLTTGASTAVTVTGTVAPTATAGTTWRATGITVTAGGETATGLADLVTTGTPVAAVSFRTTNAAATVTPGQTTSLTLTATNAGPSSATRRTAVLVAPGNTQFGPLTGTAATDCTLTSSTVVTCTYDLGVSDTKSWTVPVVVSSGVKNGDKLTAACVTADGSKTCGTDLDVSVTTTPANPISKVGTLTLDSTTVAAGASGNAVLRLSSTVAKTGLTLTVPLSTVPAGFTVKSATLAGATCTIGTSTIKCTGVDLAAGVAKPLSIGIDVASSAASTAAWWATGITLADGTDATDKLTASGLLVSTSKPAYAVSVVVGSPSLSAPLPGQTVTIPITLSNAGPGEAGPYVTTIRIPDNTTAGTLPSGCVASGQIVTCTLTIPAGTTTQIQIPFVVSPDLKGGEELTGGCIDGALAATPDPDGVCGGDSDVVIPGITSGRFKVNLAVTYDKPAVTVGPNATGVVIRIPYTNEGTDTADNVKFTVEPPAGVVVRSASILLEDTTVAEGMVLAAASTTAAAECSPAGDGKASNAVVCSAPNAAGLYGSQLILTIDGSNSKKSGTQNMKVTISTTSAEGLSTDNTVDVPLTLTAKATTGGDDDNGNNGGGDDNNGGGGDNGGDNGGGSDLPRTGAQIAGTALISLLLMVAGATLLLAMREPRPAGTPGSVRIPVRIPGYTPRHERPRSAARQWFGRRN
ncbi:hypothetical protein KOI35_12900 [Actinoplanes bogorensis]|uniref:DUF11 domain-containing protein n=1 Tax=Paractinoplanes bogorensis TaxID=1610840 RepID=A0ABS5YQV3_9ACTN|nr:DUF11 domain-containing protein [Actinoplanes bogorensis]MBU2664395.1 hypothetical protein [Actinoplanes bogorensis]